MEGPIGFHLIHCTGQKGVTKHALKFLITISEQVLIIMSW